jgi:UDP-glucuronate 4-epimerase
MSIIVTGVAGFIGSHVAHALIERGEAVVGIDNLNPYYDVRLKEARLARLAARAGFVHHRADIADKDAVARIVAAHPEARGMVHLAAQAGVRYSLENPYAYADANVMGQVVMLEAARRLPRLERVVYASSSSVYGGNDKLPFAVADRVDRPVSLYAATKRAGELIAECYAGLWGLDLVGLRFFTVYGPWGRPDMAAFLFVRAMLAGETIDVFNEGRMQRDFTYVDDIARGVLAALDAAPAAGAPRHRLYNLGNNRPEQLTDFIAILERALGVRAKQNLLPMQKGDVPATYADIAATTRALGWTPTTPLAEGLPKFVQWYREYYRV